MITHLIRILKYGTSYAIATGFFPRETAKKVLLLYSFVRIPDNIVDEVNNNTTGKINDDNTLGTKNQERGTHYAQAKTKLETLRDARIQAYTNNRRQDTQRGQYVALFQDNQIPLQYSLDFYKAMIDDCSVHRYESYEQLECYMYGSASVAGLMMCHLIGFTDPAHEETAKAYATELGNAMQLTNFLRDVREDYEDLGRIYMPLAPLSKGGYRGDQINTKGSDSSSSWKQGTLHDDIISFCHGGYATASAASKKARADTMQVSIARCRAMYAHSLDGLQYLRPEGRKAVRLAALLYASILDKIEANHYDVFSKSCRTSLWDKVKVILSYQRKK